MNKTWNKVVLAALLTAGASAGILYLKHRQDMAAQADPDEADALDTEPAEESVQPVAADRNYINLAPAHEAAAERENTAEEAAAEDSSRTEAEATQEDAADVHFSSLS